MIRPLFTLVLVLFAGLSTASVNKTAPTGEGYLACLEGIEDIPPPTSAMLAQIKAFGLANGDPAGCVEYHGGNPQGESLETAHQGAPQGLKSGNGPKTFYPDPGSIWIADNTCGQCHVGYAYRVERSLMNTEAGKIQGNLHTWGIPEVQNHKAPWGRRPGQGWPGPPEVLLSVCNGAPT